MKGRKLFSVTGEDSDAVAGVEHICSAGQLYPTVAMTHLANKGKEPSAEYWEPQLCQSPGSRATDHDSGPLRNKICAREE